MRPAPLAAAGLVLFLFARVASAEVEVSMRFGHGGNAVAGAITPYSIRIRSREATPLRLSIRASTGGQYVSGELATARDVLAPGTEKVFTFLLRVPQNPNPSFEIDFDRSVIVREGERLTPEAVRSYRHHVDAWGIGSTRVPGYAPTLLAVGRQASNLPRQRRGTHVFPLDEADLPTVWEAYDGIDTVLWVDPGENGLPDTTVVRAIERWVELGGRLVVSATRRPELLTGTPLADLLPARLGSPMPAFSYRAIAQALQPRLDVTDDKPPETARAVVPLEVGEGAVLVRGSGLPLVVEGRRGLGSVVVLAYDPREFAAAEGQLAVRFFRPLLPDLFASADYEGGPIEPGLYRDDPMGAIARLLRAGGVRTPPMGLLSLFMILYVLAVGPIDYFILKKFKLLKYSALSFLALAVLFSAGAWFFSFYLFGGSSLLNRVTLLDIIPSGAPEGGDRILANDFAGYYAPRGGTISLEAPGETRHFSDLAFAWTSMGGIGGALPRDPVRLEMTDPALPRGSIALPFRSLRTIWSRLYLERTLPLDVQILEDGSISVRNGFPFRLRNAAILGPSGAIRIGDIEPGEDHKLPGDWSARRGQPFAHGLGPRGSAPDSDMLAELAEDDLSPGEIEQAANSILAWSAGARNSEFATHLCRARVLERAGLDRSSVLQSGGVLFLAWTDEGDPLGLSDPDSTGFRITIIRKVLRP